MFGRRALFSLILIFAAAGLAVVRFNAFATTSVANITVVGYVPSVFSVRSIGQQVELDLSPGITVSNRTIGLLSFKYNENVQSLTFASDTPSGLPEDSGGNPYNFGGSGDFLISIRPGCDTVDAAYYAAFPLTSTGVDVKSALSSSLTTGIQEECEVLASYVGTSTTLPMAGRFEMNIVVTMTSF